MNAQTATLLGLGCPDCGGRCGLGQTGEEIFSSLASFLLTTKTPVTFYSKPPGDWFPLVNNEKTVSAGTFIGSITEFKVTDDKALWLKANSIAPQWFLYDPEQVEFRVKTGVQLSEAQKNAIAIDVIKLVNPGAKVVISAAELVEAGVDTVDKTLRFTTGLVKNLPLIAVGVGALIIYVKFGDDIKKAFSSPKKSGVSGANTSIKKAKKVIHI